MTARRRQSNDIDWAQVAARARAELGEERVARVSDRFRMIAMVTADRLRPGAFQPGDIEPLRFGQPPRSA